MCDGITFLLSIRLRICKVMLSCKVFLSRNAKVYFSEKL